MPVPLGIVIEPPTPDAVLPRGRKQHCNPNGEVVWITDSATIAPDSQVTIEAGSQLGVDVSLAGNTTIAAEAEIGNFVEINGGIVEEGARVGDDSVIEGGTVKTGAKVGQDNRIETGGVVGKGAYTGPGFLVEEGRELEPNSIHEHPTQVAGS